MKTDVALMIRGQCGYILDVLMHTITYEQLLGDVETHETQDRVLVYVVRLFLD